MFKKYLMDLKYRAILKEKAVSEHKQLRYYLKMPFIALKNHFFKPIGKLLHKLFGWINETPLYVTLPILCMFIFFAISQMNTHTYNKWTDFMKSEYPTLTMPVTDEQGNMMASPLDAYQSNVSRNINGVFFIMFWFIIGQFLRSIWGNINPRKPQVLVRG